MAITFYGGTVVRFGISHHVDNLLLSFSRRLCDEIDEVLPNGAEVDDNTYSKLLYTQNVIKESMRFFAPVMVTIRTTSREVEARGFKFKKVCICAYGMMAAFYKPNKSRGSRPPDRTLSNPLKGYFGHRQGSST